MRGRKPVPTALKVLHGNPSGRPLNPSEPLPRSSLTEPPLWLSEDQKDGWRYVIEHAPPGLLRTLDRGLLAVWVIAEDTHRRAAESVRETGLMTKWPGVPMPQQNPYLAVLNKQALIMVKVASELGFTPASRSRVASAGEAMPLPGVPEGTPAQVPRQRAVPLDDYLAGAPIVPTMH